MFEHYSKRGQGRETSLAWNYRLLLSDLMEGLAKEFPDSQPSDFEVETFDGGAFAASRIIIRRRPERYQLPDGLPLFSGYTALHRDREVLIVSVPEPKPAPDMIPVVYVREDTSYQHVWVPSKELRKIEE